MPKSNQVVQQSNSELKQELRRRLQQRVSITGLADKIADLLKPFGKRPGTPEQVAMRLANGLASKFAKQNRELEQLIENRPEELRNLLRASVGDECQRFIRANLGVLRRTRTKVTTNEERLRRTKIAKNLYEHLRRSHVRTPGWIERDFAERSGSFLLDPYHAPPPTGPCLDEIFRGGTTRMCNGMSSLQSLFGLGRKRLSAARPAMRRGRETFYDYRAVLCCMVALLKQTGRAARWLPDAARRRTVLTRILFRARQKATPEIREAFERTLLPHLN
jgi:hypothetical protein